jgi:hypothetical protein
LKKNKTGKKEEEKKEGLMQPLYRASHKPGHSTG